jgi:hypothetical protein
MTEQQRNTAFVMSDGWYNFLKRLVQVVIPAFGTFYVTLGQTWDFPRPDDVATTCLALSAFLGLCLGISNAQYNASGKGIDGSLTMTPPTADSPGQVTAINTKGLTEEALAGKKSITLKVEQQVPVAGPAELEDDEDEPELPPMNPATDTRRRAKAPKASKKNE